MKVAISKWFFLSMSVTFLLVACGGGSGVGPTEVKKRDDELKKEIRTYSLMILFHGYVFSKLKNRYSKTLELNKA